MPARRPMLLAIVWLVGVGVATGIGLLGVRLVADQVGDPAVPVLSSDDVTKALGSAAPAAPTARPRPTSPPTRATARASATATPGQSTNAPGHNVAPSPQRSGPVRAFSSTGGTVGVRCSGSSPVKVYATPAQGYHFDESSTEGSVLEVRFESGDERTRVRIKVSCGSGTPVLVERRVDTSGGKG